ncbi:MAG TPA: ATP-binding protein [Spirochaetota bacterium]|nr:ATP-binding protein [Spirochaetota bacterium]
MEKGKIIWSHNLLYWAWKIFIPNLILAIYILSIICFREDVSGSSCLLIIIGMLVYFFVRLYFYYYKIGFFLWNNVQNLREVINEFKKGRFTVNETINNSVNISPVLQDLLGIGKQFDLLLSSQDAELKKFHEIYSNIINSMNSSFIVLDREEKIVYTNEGFCKKFHVDQERIIGKSLNSVFYFVNTRLKMGISQILQGNSKEDVILKNVHLMSIHRKSIISDIKISYMKVGDDFQIIVIIDDITDRFSKDYHASILSHLSETLGDETGIETTYYNILVGVTSGSGLGFNRAMLFMVEDDSLKGKMAVGPDSFDEAIEIWNSLGSSDSDLLIQYPMEIKRGELLRRVLDYNVKLSEENIFTNAVKNKERCHIKNAWNDPRVDDTIRHFLEVDEFIVMPMVSSGKAIGIIVADNKYNMTSISQQSIELLAIFAYQAAFLVENYLNLISVKREMKRLEERQEAIVESEKMAAVGRIASHIAHEIRNPLVTMGGYAKRILKNIEGDEVDLGKIEKSADIILKESERLEKILSNVMDFTKPAKYIKEFHNINIIIKDTHRLLKNLLLEKNIQVELNLDENLPEVQCDFNQMKQVLLNLFQNAIDATPSGGNITVNTDFDEKNIYIKVADSGTGIQAEDVEVIFEPFFTTKITGVGLGLANVKKIIKDHRGKIWAKNKDEGGAEFSIRLPIPSLENKINEAKEVF